MNNTDQNLLLETDHMTESNLVSLDDWKLANLRLAMLKQVEETLSAAMRLTDDQIKGEPARKIKPRALSQNPVLASA